MPCCCGQCEDVADKGLTPSLLSCDVQRIATVAQLTLLTPVDAAGGDRPLCVANTHLFYHFMAPHIRTMHVWAIMQVRCVVIVHAIHSMHSRGRGPSVTHGVEKRRPQG